ncbi:MAG: ribonuclease P protein component [Verrucomicrobiota bacterium]|jgi:ribonuclease P protein component|nr:ribonuclease P protein component [Verrucomicrobiota bacterium]
MTTEAPTRLRLTRAMRIRQGGDFARLKRHGRRVVRGCLIINWLELPIGSQPKFAVITTRKLGNAVIRNRCRRLLRECLRLHQHALRQPLEIVMIARRSLVGHKYAAVEKDFLAAMQEAKLTN